MIIRYEKEGVDRFFLCVFLFLASGNFSPYLIPNNFSFFNQALILLICFYFLTNGGRGVKKIKKVSLLMLIYLTYLLYFFISLSWSAFTSSSILKLLVLSITTYTAAHFSVRFDVSTMLRCLYKSQLTIVVLSVATVILFPSIGMSTLSHEGAWNGIFDQKNTFGRSVSLLMISSLLLSLNTSKIIRARYFLVVALCTLFLVMSDSRTALYISLLFALIIFLMVTFKRVTFSSYFSVVSYLVLVGFIVFCLNSDHIYLDRYGAASDFLYIYGFEFPLTGRATLWMFSTYSLDYYEKFLFGFGFDGFWGRDFSIMYNWGMDEFVANDAHSGFYDVLLQGGYVGFFMICVVLSISYIALCNGLRLADNDLRFKIFTVFVLFLYIVLSNLTESTFLKSTNIMQFIFSYIIFSIGALRVERAGRD